MFLERLNAISDRIEGAIAVSLVDRDGIPVESVSARRDLDLESVAAELVSLVRSSRSSSRAVGRRAPAVHRLPSG